ncbi:MAG TPA: hypothetical protein VG273_04485 [Bryobacteraceae bacterium]|nr:hypothetical protein [Bryobacteraceae bacterium]
MTNTGPDNKWLWPEILDALIAAPEYHFLLMENEHVRVLDTRIPPGHTVPLHTHRWPGTLYILSWSEFIRRDAEGKITRDSRVSGPLPVSTALWSEPLPPHTLENTGAAELRIIVFELKN